MVTPKSSSPSFAMALAQTVRTNAALPQKFLPGSMVGSYAPTPSAIGLPTGIVTWSNARHSSVVSPRTMPNQSPSHTSVMVPCVHVGGLSACPPTLTVVSASSARLKTPYFFFVQGPPLRMVPPQMIIGYPLKHSTFLLTPLAALLYRSLTTFSPPVPRMGVQVVRVLQGTALSAPITITRDASDLNIPS
jgi:hypothetical protein